MNKPTSVSADSFETSEKERAKRLAKFVKDETRNMWIEARFDFTAEMMTYLSSEIEELRRRANV